MAHGLPGVVLVGLPDAVVRQSVDRVRAAVVNAGATFPHRRITIGLSPASMPKQGSGFDLAARRRGPGRLRRGAAPRRSTGWCCWASSASTARSAPSAACCRRSSPRRGPATAQVVVPAANADEAALVDSIEVLAATTLAEVVAHLAGRARLTPHVRGPLPTGAAGSRPAATWSGRRRDGARSRSPPPAGTTCSSPVRRARARRCWPSGCPACCRRWTSRPRSRSRAIHSVAGTLPPERAAGHRGRTFEAPHHSATMAALIGGGSGQIRPGALCRAHRGVLFLDEAPEFPRAVLDTLRQPLERGAVTIHRAAGSATFPCRAQLVLAANPCPCATAAGDTACTCSPLRAPPLPVAAVRPAARPDRPARRSAAGHAGRLARRRGAAGVHRGRRRPGRDRPGGRGRAGWPAPGCRSTARSPAGSCASGGRCRGRPCRLAERALERGALSVRGFDRVLRVAWTLARPGRPRGAREPTRSPRRSACGCSGPWHDPRRGPRGRAAPGPAAEVHPACGGRAPG